MATRHGSLRALRLGNRELLLRLLREHGSTHRAELARHAGLSRSAVTGLVADLLAEGLIIEREDDSAARSRRGSRGRSMLTLNPAAGLVLGLDFSFSELRVVVADLAHTVLAKQVAPLPEEQAWRRYLDIAVGQVDEVLATGGLPQSRVIGAGLGVPGPVDRDTRTVGLSSNSAVWEGANPADELAERLQIPIAIGNTAHLGCLAEATWGAAAGCRDVLYVKLSTGVGSGVMTDGSLIRGAGGSAGELGHMTVDESGPACRCGNRGCLEAYAGTQAVLDAMRPVLGDATTIDDVIVAAGGGNRAASRVLADIGQIVGRALGGVVNLLNPRTIVVGGDLAPAGPILLDPLEQALRRSALSVASDIVEIRPATFGRMAGALGGVALALHDDAALSIRGLNAGNGEVSTAS